MKIKLIKIISILIVILLIIVTALGTSYLYQYKILKIIIEFFNAAFPIILAVNIIKLSGKSSTAKQHIASFFLTIYYALNTFLLSYFFNRHFTFDYYFFWYNRNDAIETVRALSGDPTKIIIPIFILITTLYYGILNCIKNTTIKPSPIPKSIFFKITTTAFSIILLWIYITSPNETIRMLNGITPERKEILNLYYKNYNLALELNKSSQTKIINTTTQDNLFMIHLESINSKIVNSTNTPELINISNNHGIFFPQIQSSSVLTIRSQEVILCGTLPSLGPNLSPQNHITKHLNCLPKILKDAGYHTMFFQSYANLQFANTKQFLSNIGFNEVHSDDIMKPEDKELVWGYPENIFYKRVFEYLAKQKDKKIFAYIAVSSTNHHPFYNEEKTQVYPQFKKSVPFINPTNLVEKLTNTTYIQDAFFGEMIKNHYLPNYSDNSNLLVFGDHSWPIEIHKGNKYNENQAFQENFVSTLSFLPSKQNHDTYNIGHKVTQLYNHIDILNTILDIQNITKTNKIGNSFFQSIIKTPNEESSQICMISVQPFTNKYIVTIKFPFKKIYNTTTNLVSTYNLEKDPNELQPISTKNINDNDLSELDACLKQALNK